MLRRALIKPPLLVIKGKMGVYVLSLRYSEVKLLNALKWYNTLYFPNVSMPYQMVRITDSLRHAGACSSYVSPPCLCE